MTFERHGRAAGEHELIPRFGLRVIDLHWPAHGMRIEITVVRNGLSLRITRHEDGLILTTRVGLRWIDDAWSTFHALPVC